jgi:LemA protein
MVTGVLVAALVLVLILAALGVSLYNGLVSLRNRFKNAFQQIDVQLKRRHDLVPNLVSVAKAYLKHEHDTFEDVTRARAAAVQASEQARAAPGGAGAMGSLGAAESALGSALGRLLVVAERYPELKAQTSLSELSEDLRSTENRIAFARQHYNDAVMEYDNRRQAFPAVLFAGALGFEAAAPLEIITDEREKHAPKIEL